MKKGVFIPVFLLTGIIVFFFSSFFIKGKLPIPSDTIIGLYHPFRDLYSRNYPNGIPFKNFLITDPVRQQYPWKDLVVSTEKRKELPLWNPYNMSGTPLLANFQSAVFYPLNVLFFILSFNIGWSIYIFLGPLMAGIFLYLYLLNLKLNKWACFSGAFAFSFSGFFTAWMEWGTITHTALWLPLILLSIDKLFSYSKEKFSIFNFQFSIWSFIFIFSLISSFFAGHLQIFFYLFLLSIAYFFVRWIQFGKEKSVLYIFAICYLIFTIIASVQWLPTLQLIIHSARDIDQTGWQQAGWFIPWQHLIQFIAPDFFGNPTTLNYWGVWNYGEFIGYTGILPLIFGLLALFFRRDKKSFFWGTIFFLSLIFSLPTIFAKLSYVLNIPFLSTSQPTRLLFVTDFSLAVLSALGFDYFIKHKKEIFYPLGFIALIIAGLWIFIFEKGSGLVLGTNLAVAKSNLIFPTIIFIAVSILIIIFVYHSRRHSRGSGNPEKHGSPIKSGMTVAILILLIGITVFDLLRFSSKFTPFTNKEYLFPDTKAISFLKNQPGIFRIMTTDDRILPPNFSSIYRLQSVNGYDPLYLKRYGELIAASERRKADINPPFGFNRIVTPKNFDSKIIDLLGVKYILSLSDISSPKLKKIFQEGQTQVYENKDVLPRVFFVENIYYGSSKNETVNLIFQDDFDLKKRAVIEASDPKDVIFLNNWSVGNAEIISYSENKVVIKTKNKDDGFLVLTDSYYPSWHAKIDGRETKIYRTDYNFRGIIIPKGNHVIEFYNSLF